MQANTNSGILRMAAFALLTIATAVLSMATTHAQGQNQGQGKTGVISFNELLQAMPESRRADSALARYRDTLASMYEAYKKEYTDQAALLNSPDTAKLTAPQRDLKRRSLGELVARIQGYEEEAGQLFSQRRTILLQPIQKKAEDAIAAVSRDNGYAFILEKEELHVYPPGSDILPLVKKKLGIM